MNELDKMNDMKVTRQICSITILNYTKIWELVLFFFESYNCPKYLLFLRHKCY